jgi:biopolymer transport protein ExbD
MNFRSENETRKPLIMFSQAGLTDIVMLLLIFFLLTSSFVANMGIKINLPRAETGGPANDRFVTVTIAKDGRFFVESTQVTRDQLAKAVRDEIQKTRKQALVVRADKDAKVDDAVRVMNIAKALNLTILMATERAPSD